MIDAPPDCCSITLVSKTEETQTKLTGATTFSLMTLIIMAPSIVTLHDNECKYTEVNMTIGIKTLNITTISVTKLSITIHSIMTLNITTITVI